MSTSSRASSGELAFTALAAVALVGLMVASTYWVFPNGETLGFGGFVMFWLREIWVLGLLAYIVLHGAVLWLVRRVRRRHPPESSAL